ncbi:MAG: Rieske (2Fe-2S) protein [Leptolyngbya sp. SIO1D8]|nr:Rieske (2Fe-2S) protein [Leptolyngbya sp. SIO1D8]
MVATHSLETQKYFVPVAQVEDIEAAGVLVVHVEGQGIALFHHQGQIYALDNRCPHMGFPLHKGSVKDCILTCHWHHARFDLTSGGTFDIWADDGRAFPVELRGSTVWIDLTPKENTEAYQQQRLVDGLEQGISLVIAKAVMAQLTADVDPVEPFQVGLRFGVQYRQEGWGSGLTMHTCLMQLLPYLEPGDRPRALYHGLSAVARDCAGQPPRFPIQPLPETPADFETLKGWFRQFIQVRDAQGAERCLVSAIHAGCTPTQLADMLFAAVTDYRFLDGGHALDFTNKALEALDFSQWQQPEKVLTSLVRGYAKAERMEESNAWRYPIDLVAILEDAFAQLPDILMTRIAPEAEADSDAERPASEGLELDRDRLVLVLLGDDPHAIANALLAVLRQGWTPEALAETVAYAAARRIAQFQTNNDFRDWDEAHHTFTFANAVYQGLQRVTSLELLRGVFDAAMAVYLDRFLNVPPARLPNPAKQVETPEALLAELPELLNRQQQVTPAGRLVGTYLYSGGDPDRLLALLGKLLLREDRDFHTIQNVAAAFQQYEALRHQEAGIHVLVATTRYLAAHAPTMRSQGQTYEMAARLQKGDRMYE